MGKNKEYSAFLIIILSEVLFGLSFLFVKISVTSVSIFTLLSWRNVLAVLFMTIFAKVGLLDVQLRGKNVRPLLLLSLFQPVAYYICEAVGVKMTTASESGVFISIMPIVTMIFSTIFLKDRPSVRQVLFMILTVLGAVTIAGIGGFTTSSSFIGYLFLALAVCSDSAYAITAQKIKDFNNVEKTYVMAATGAVVFTACAVVEHTIKGTMMQYITMPFQDTDFLLSILYLSIFCNCIAFIATNYGISIIGATRRASFVGIASITSILSGVIFLGESFTLPQVVATAMILIGVFGVNHSPTPKNR